FTCSATWSEHHILLAAIELRPWQRAALGGAVQMRNILAYEKGFTPIGGCGLRLGWIRASRQLSRGGNFMIGRISTRAPIRLGLGVGVSVLALGAANAFAQQAPTTTCPDGSAGPACIISNTDARG